MKEENAKYQYGGKENQICCKVIEYYTAYGNTIFLNESQEINNKWKEF